MAGVGRSLIVTPQEYKSIFAIGKRQAQGNTIADLTALYDCNPLNLRLREKKLQAKNYCINILTCSTQQWLNDMFVQDNVSGGFVNRHLFGLCEISPVYKEDILEITESDINCLAADISQVIPPKKMTFESENSLFISHDTKTLSFEDEFAKSKFHDYSKQSHVEAYKKAQCNDSNLDLKSREGIHALKIAGLHSICRNKMTVDSEAIEFGIKWAQASSKVLLSLSRVNDQRSSKEDSESNDVKILGIINRHFFADKKPVKDSVISKVTGKNQFNNKVSLISLLQQKRITKIDDGYIPVIP